MRQPPKKKVQQKSKCTPRHLEGVRRGSSFTTTTSYCSGERRTIWIPPFIFLRSLTYSSGRSQRTGTYNPIKSAMLPINDVQLDISALQTGELACSFLM